MAAANDIKLNNVLSCDTLVSLLFISDIPFGVISDHDRLLFTVSAQNTDMCNLKLYRKNEKEPAAIVPMNKMMGNVFQAAVDNKKLNADYYLYETDGKEYVDPYARKLKGREQFGRRLTKEEKSSIRGSWKIENFDWDTDKPVFHSWPDTIMYKLHVRGFTKLADVPMKHKGTYLGIADKAEYFVELGVNSLLLMPCVEFDEIMEEASEGFGRPDAYSWQNSNDEGTEKNSFRINYWGYTDNCNYFAPKASYASKPDEASYEFKYMVKVLHQHGIEVLMEMQFNKGISQKIMIDCLKYWAVEYHIDGFKINTEVMSEIVLLEEPWLADKKIITAGFTDIHKRLDVYTGSKKRLASYNEGFMYDARMFIKGDDNKAASFIDRTSKGTAEAGIINFIADNNGFTLMDVYSYDCKHNEENNEENKDGRDYNFSWNCGIEGKTKRKDITSLRLKMRKNAFTALILSQGTPMIYQGDEFGNSQNGNNNSYCQDNPAGWVDWKAKKNNEELFLYVKQLIEIRNKYMMLHYPTELRKMDYISCGYPDITFHGRSAWYPDYSGRSRALGIMLCGRYANLITGRAEEDIYIVYNMHWEPHVFDLPSMSSDIECKLLLSTEEKGQNITSACRKKDSKSTAVKDTVKQYMIAPRSVAVFVNEAVIIAGG